MAFRLRGWGLAFLLLLSLPPFACAQSGTGKGGTTEPYIDPRQQTAIAFDQRSHWLQPWRAYEETPPASRLLNGIGINLNVPPEQADAVCAQLARSGFKHVRFEIGWGSMTEDDPPRLGNPTAFGQLMAACKRHGLRPLILLNANQMEPCPAHSLYVRLTRSAAKGDRTLSLDPKDAGKIVPHHSGLNNMSELCAAEILFTSVEADGTAHLSRALPKPIPAGVLAVTTLKYRPFFPVKPDGSGSAPDYYVTLNGWLAYVGAVGKAAKATLGTEGKPDAGFDFEVWNELSFGSRFLVANNYYEKPVATGDWCGGQMLASTAKYVHDPKQGLPGVGIGDGFDNEMPWGAGSTEPAYVTAIDKHPYHGPLRFTGPASAMTANPLDALGHPEGTRISDGLYRDAFTPDYVAYFPEYYLTAIQTEHDIRDISPITTRVNTTEHGRNTRGKLPDGSPTPTRQLWVTEVAMDAGFDESDRAAFAKAAGLPPSKNFDFRGYTTADADRLRSKAALRYLSSWIGRGTSRIYFYAAKVDNPYGFGLVGLPFFDALKSGRKIASNDDSLVSPALLAIRRLTQALTLPAGEKLTHSRELHLLSVSDNHGHYQFAGDPATANQKPNPHPPLYDRDCIGFFPFQVSDNRIVAPVYVMTRDLGHLYHPEAPKTDPTRSDLPDEAFRLKIRGIGTSPHFTFTDPVDGGRDVSGVRIAETAKDGTITLELPLTDRPRLLTIVDSPPGASKVK